MDPATIGMIASGVGSLAGGLFGDDGPSLKEQYGTAYEDAKRRARELPLHQVRGFERAGIHPIFGFGGGGGFSSSPSVQVGGGNSPDFNAMGQGIDRAMRAGQSSRMDKLLERGAELDIRRKELENSTLESTALASKLSLRRQTGSPPQIGDGIELNPSKAFSSSKKNSGVEAAATPANKIYVGYDGEPVLSPSSEYAETMEGNWPVGMAQNLIHNTIPWYYDRIKSWPRRMKQSRHYQVRR